MNEKIQFIKWCGRKILGHIFLPVYSIKKYMRSFAVSLRKETLAAILAWLAFSLIWVLFTTVICAASKISLSAVEYVVCLNVLITVGILLWGGISALYSVFKEEQQQLMDNLSKQYDV